MRVCPCGIAAVDCDYHKPESDDRKLPSLTFRGEQYSLFNTDVDKLRANVEKDLKVALEGLLGRPYHKNLQPIIQATVETVVRNHMCMIEWARCQIITPQEIHELTWGSKVSPK